MSLDQDILDNQAGVGFPYLQIAGMAGGGREYQVTILENAGNKRLSTADSREICL